MFHVDLICISSKIGLESETSKQGIGMERCGLGSVRIQWIEKWHTKHCGYHLSTTNPRAPSMQMVPTLGPEVYK